MPNPTAPWRRRDYAATRRRCSPQEAAPDAVRARPTGCRPTTTTGPARNRGEHRYAQLPLSWKK
ncbi:MAG TPA: hypothetical protein VFP54_09690 [Acidimicrobiales bacterium]|nr:hypothetical protein [Acidimicrobiales bacterium]